MLTLIMCVSVIPAGVIGTAEEAGTSSHVYMIMTNPGEDCRTEMRIGFHSDYLYTNCYVEYTTADDKTFMHAVRADGAYDDQKYLWFFNRLTTNNLSDSRFGTKFLDWGIELEGLTPDTDYIYRVCDGDGGYSDTYSFKTAGADEYSIIWMSDAHVNAGYTGRLNAWVNMFKYAETQAKYDVAFQFSTGDSTTSGDRYGDWLTISEQDFTKNYMIANVIGNHDVYDSIMDDDTTYYTQYWKSGQYFEVVYNHPRNGFTASSQRINGYLSADSYTDYASQSANYMIDVSAGVHSGKQITGAMDNTDGRMYWFNYNGILFIIFDYYCMMFAEDTKNAFEWAGKVIEENYGKYDYIVCANHINLVNGGGGAFRDYGAVDYDYFGDFFDKYGVDMYLAGDNHVYLRTNAIYDGAVSSDPDKGTYIIQAPCLSRPQNFDAKDAAGFAVKQYSVSGTTVGGLVIDVDENGLTFNCLVYEMLSSTPYSRYDSFTVPKREKPKAKEVGHYVFNNAEALCSSPSADYAAHEIDFTDYEMYVYDTYKNYGLVLGAGVATWLDLTEATFVAGGERENGAGYISIDIDPAAAVDGAAFYTSVEAYNAQADAIAANLGSKNVYGLKAQYGEFYSVNGEISGTDSTGDYDAVIVCEKEFFNNNFITLDRINNNAIYAIASANFNDTAPEGIIFASGKEFSINAQGATFENGVTVKELDDAILNAEVVVTDNNGNELNWWENVPRGGKVTVYNGDSEEAVSTFDILTNVYTVEFQTKDGADIVTVTVSAGTDAVAPEAPEVEGYEFAGWDKNIRNVQGDITTKAIYVEKEEEDSGDDSSGSSYTPVYGGNRLLGESYTYTSMNGFQGVCKDDNKVLLTDGVARPVDMLTVGGMIGYTVELNGTYQENIIDFTLNGGREIASIVLKGVRKVNELSSVNRHCNLASVYVSTDGVSYQLMDVTIVDTPIEGAPLYTEDNGVTNYNQFYNVTATFSQPVENVVGLRVILNTARADGSRGYIVQLDEIAAYGAEGCIEDDSSEDTSSESSSSEDVVEVVYGDVNGDDKINSLDAAQILKHDALMIQLSDEALLAGDVNGDGKVNSLDAAQILKYDALIIDKFPAEK